MYLWKILESRIKKWNSLTQILSQRTRMSTLLLSWLCLMMAMYNLGARNLSMLGFHTGSPSTKYQRKKNDCFCNLPIWKCLITNDLTSLKWCVCSFLDNAWSFYGTYCRRMHIFRPWVTCVSGFGWGCMEASHHRWKKKGAIWQIWPNG